MRAYKFKKLKRIHGVHFTPDGSQLLAVGGAEVRMVDSGVWLDLASGENVGRFDQYSHSYAVTADLSRVALAGASNWRGGLAQVQWTRGPGCAWEQFAWAGRGVPPSYRDVCGLAFDPTGPRLAVTHTRSRRRSSPLERVCLLTVVDRDTGERQAELPIDFVAAVTSFNHDGSRLSATGGIDGDTRVAVFDVAAKRELFRFAPPATVTRTALFLPDGRVAVANGHYVYLLPPDGGDPLLTLSGHPKQVNAVAVTPDGTRLLTASHDGSIRTWDATTGASGASFDWSIGPVTALAFSPDGLTCAAAGLNGSVVVWDADG